MNSLNFRKANIDDIDLIFEWANDKVVRNNSFDSNPIKFSQHKIWFENHMKDIYIFLCDDKPIGQLRLEINGEEAAISYSIAKEYRGCGYGKKIIEASEEIAKQYDNVVFLEALVKDDNEYSNKIFEKLEYTKNVKEGYIEYRKRIIL